MAVRFSLTVVGACFGVASGGRFFCTSPTGASGFALEVVVAGGAGAEVTLCGTHGFFEASVSFSGALGCSCMGGAIFCGTTTVSAREGCACSWLTTAAVGSTFLVDFGIGVVWVVLRWVKAALSW